MYNATVTMLPQEITHEQAYLQHLWNKYRHTGQVAYASRQGWWVLMPDEKQQVCDILFLGRVIEEAQQSIREGVE